MNVEFSFAKGFSSINKKMFAEMQKYADTECIRLMTPYVPVGEPRYKNSGNLRDSVQNPEPGKITYGAGVIKGGQSIAWRSYYLPMNHARSGNPNAQRLWFEYMKAKDGSKIRQGLAKIAKGR